MPLIWENLFFNLNFLKNVASIQRSSLNLPSLHEFRYIASLNDKLIGGKCG